MRSNICVAAIAAVALAASCTRTTPTADVDLESSAKAGNQALFNNGGFEADNTGVTPSSWTVQKYLNPGVTGSDLAPPTSLSALNLQTSSSSKFETFVQGGTTGSQFDPDLGDLQAFRFPIYGTRSARVNYLSSTENGKNKNANLLKQSYAVTSEDVDLADNLVHVRFVVAPVLENPDHIYTEQPYFFVQLHNVTQNSTLYTMFNRAGEEGVPWHSSTGIRTGYPTQWLDWQLIDIAPGNTALAVGDTVELTVVAAGCVPGGHFGRVYVDGVGTKIPGTYVSATAAAEVDAGTTLTYTLRYSNGGTDAATGVSVSMTLPPQTTFASTDGVQCSTPAVGDAGVVTCSVGDIEPDAFGQFTITVNVLSTASGTIVNGDYSIASNGPTLLGPKVTTVVHALCTSDANCSLNTPICDTDDGHCNACASHAECAARSAANPYCESTGNCVACQLDSQCGVATKPFCDPSDKVCVGCSTDAQCIAKTPATPACASNGACYQCTADSDCSGGTPACNTSSHTCVAAPCTPDLVAPSNGTVSATTGVTGDTRTYTCNTGFTLNGSATTTCLSDRTWSSPPPTCGADLCTETLVAPANGTVDGTNGVTGDVRTYTCNPAYELQGSATTTCQADHTWSSAAPTCTQIPGACSSDAMCNADQWCDIAALTCTAKIANSGGMPIDTGHIDPVLDGDCVSASSTAAVLVCESGVCDSEDDRCGFANGHGTCTSSDASVCRSGVCSAGGTCGLEVGESGCTVATGPVVCQSGVCSANGGICQPIGGCGVDADCGTTEWCDTSTYACKPKLDNDVTIPTVPAHTPVLDGSCSDAVAVAVCASGVCYADGKCGYPNEAGPCDAEDNDDVCRSGNCSIADLCVPALGCYVDGDCDDDDWCNTETLSCTAKIINGGDIPTVEGHTPTLEGNCTPSVAVAVCASGVCADDDACGYPSLVGPCTPETAGVVCRSSVCSPNTEVCIPSGGCAVDDDCAATEWCDNSTLSCVPKRANGEQIPEISDHSPPLTGACTAEAGVAICVSGVCDIADNRCGYTDGSGTCTVESGSVVCRSGVCSADGVCLALESCRVDADCDVATQYCDTGTLTCAPKVANGQPLPSVPGHAPSLDGTCTAEAALVVCLSGVCDEADDLCGHANGVGPCDAANGALVCRSAACVVSGSHSGTCGECATDSDCGGVSPACDLTTATCVQCTETSYDACVGVTPVCVDGHCDADASAEPAYQDVALDDGLVPAGSGLGRGCQAVDGSGYAVGLALLALARRRRRLS